jgi:hypothetical protein
MSTARVTYTPGQWLAVIGPTTWALIDVMLDDPRVAALWEAAAQGPDELLDVLLRDGLRSLPGFAIANLEGTELRYAVRTPGVLDFEDAAVGGSIDATAADSWASGRVPTPHGWLALRGGGTDASVELPTAAGVTPASMLRVSFDTTSAESHPQAEVEPPPSSTSPISEPGPDDATPEPETRPADEAGEPNTASHASTYFQLLNSSTIERDALLSKLLAEDDETSEHASPATEEQSPLPTDSEPQQTASDATSVWTPDPDESSAAAVGLDADAGTASVIDGLPWQSGEAPIPSPPEPATEPNLTTYTPPGAIPGPRPLPLPPIPETEAPGTDELDPMSVTINRAALRRQLQESREKAPTLLALRCKLGHLSPTYAATCRVCGAELGEQNPVEAVRPSLGQLVLSNGSAVVLDKGVIFGRSPQSDLEDPAERPNLVRLIDSAEISRMHASIMLDGWQVLLRDLGSQNGTILTLPGHAPEQIRPNEDYVLEPGSIVSFADVVSGTFEVTE